jgi:aspartyl-tRNA(Asn)/glutamyl-tRNA(Gln) amidotransferase subunit B
MEEGSMRCDANISIRLKGVKTLGTKVEVKNLNSIRNVKKAIEYEIRRMVELVESGGQIVQQTRSYDAATDTTFAMRTKEEANDYRYFADPDLPRFVVSAEWLDSIKKAMPALPAELMKKYIQEFCLSEYNAKVISNDKGLIAYFNNLVQETKHYKSAANWLLGPVKSYLNDKNLTIEEFTLAPSILAELVELVESGKINFSTGSSKILPALLQDGSKKPLEIAAELNLLQDSDSSSIEALVEEVLSKMPGKVEEYRKGKKGLIGLFVGEVKKLSKGKADPVIATRLLTEKLSG